VNENTPKKSGLYGCCVSLIIVLFVLFVVTMVWYVAEVNNQSSSSSPSSPSSPSSQKFDKYTAVGTAKSEIEKRLTSPSTAKFGGWEVTEITTDEWLVLGYVDSQNSFGATVRQYFGVAIQVTGYKGDTFTYTGSVEFF
jgi:hypothetical protein